MAKKMRIFKQDGTPTQFFWSDQDRNDRKTVYKQTPKGVKRMLGVHFDAQKNRLEKE